MVRSGRVVMAVLLPVLSSRGERAEATEPDGCGDKISVIRGLVPFQPQGSTLTAADTEADQRALGFAALQFFQTREDDSRPRRADRMAESDGPAVQVEFLEGFFSECMFAAKNFFREFVGLHRFQYCERLRGER